MTAGTADLEDNAPAASNLISTDDALEEILPALAASPGPVAADTERASGFRYVQCAYLIQLKTMGTGTLLIDPVDLSPQALSDLNSALIGKEWIIHSASQDLPALRMSGLTPQALFDTELSGRLLNHEKVGLGPLLEEVLGVTLAKEHGNSDWSQRPLPQSWLTYAGDDVEYLIELADALATELDAARKRDWADQEFAHTLAQPVPAPKPDPWRSTTDIHLVTTRRGLEVLRQIWTVRDAIAQELDLAPHRILNDRALSALASHVSERSVAAAARGLGSGDFRHRIPKEHIQQFRDAVAAAGATNESELPLLRVSRQSMPGPGLWLRKKPEAARRWELVRPEIKALAETHQLPVENLISPKPLRMLLWEPEGSDAQSIDAQLADLDVRPWQRELVVPVITGLLAELD